MQSSVYLMPTAHDPARDAMTEPRQMCDDKIFYQYFSYPREQYDCSGQNVCSLDTVIRLTKRQRYTAWEKTHVSQASADKGLQSGLTVSPDTVSRQGMGEMSRCLPRYCPIFWKGEIPCLRAISLFPRRRTRWSASRWKPPTTKAFKTILRKIIFNVKSCLLNFTKNIRIT